MNNSSTWKRLTTLSKDQLEEPPRIYAQSEHKMAPSYYCDIDGKEWIVILKRDYPSSENIPLTHPRCDSYLYDVKNDTFIPFIRNYQNDIRDKFNIE